MGFLLRLYRFLRGNNCSQVPCDHEMSYDEKDSLNYYSSHGMVRVYHYSVDLHVCSKCGFQKWKKFRWISLPNYGKDVYI